MKIPMYQADAFTDKLFGGNPAAICILDNWLDEHIMQSIAAENNLAETAFIVKTGGGYNIRWFTPTVEVDLCGHATLASAHVVFNHIGHGSNEITFHSDRSGELKVSRDGSTLMLNFPADVMAPVDTPAGMPEGLGIHPLETYKGKTDYMAVLGCEQDLKNVKPDFGSLAALDCRGIIVTAKGDTVDFVSRFFAPQSGIDEDPVTGSAHTSLTPYWAKRLGKTELSAIQLSPRRGYLTCKDMGDRVGISGNAVTYMTAEINV